MKNKSASARPPAPTTHTIPATGTVKPARDTEMLLACRPTAHMGIELAVPAGKDPGILAQVLRAVAGRKVNILAYCTAFELDHFTILLVTDAALTAKHALADAGLSCTARSVVLVSAEDRVDTPAALFNQLSEARIAVRYGYVAALKPYGLCAVFSTADDQRAMRVLAGADVVHAASR